MSCFASCAPLFANVTLICRPSFYLPLTKFSVAVSCCPIVFELKPDTENVLKYDDAANDDSTSL